MDIFMLKNCATSVPDTRKQPYVYKWINYHKTRNINMSQPAMLLVPGHNRGYMGAV